jgi:hypothetical protein
MPPQITDWAIDARDEDAICLNEVIIVCRWKEMILQKSDAVHCGLARGKQKNRIKIKIL